MGKNIVITGSTRGIGLAMAQEFLAAGCNVTFSGRNNEPSAACKELAKKFKAHTLYCPCDVQDKAAIKNLWHASAEKWGDIDIWINNAGQNSPHAFVWEIGKSATENVLWTNILGVIFGGQIAAENMLKQKHGAIYSMEGLGSNDMIQPKTVIYGTTKRALTYFMKGLEKELHGSGVIAGRLSPGMMLTDFITKTPEGKPAKVIEDMRFRRIFNILADKPETVAAFLVQKMIANNKNGRHIVWLTNMKVLYRFLTGFFIRRNIL